MIRRHQYPAMCRCRDLSLIRRLLLAALLLCLITNKMPAQTNPNQDDTTRWLAGVGAVPPFNAPGSRQEWEASRPQIRAQLWQLLGKLPPRPAQPSVKTLSHEERDGYIVEKFEFDNGAGATVPGYILIPKEASTDD